MRPASVLQGVARARGPAGTALDASSKSPPRRYPALTYLVIALIPVTSKTTKAQSFRGPGAHALLAPHDAQTAAGDAPLVK